MEIYLTATMAQWNLHFRGGHMPERNSCCCLQAWWSPLWMLDKVRPLTRPYDVAQGCFSCLHIIRPLSFYVHIVYWQSVFPPQSTGSITLICFMQTSKRRKQSLMIRLNITNPANETDGVLFIIGSSAVDVLG